MRMMMMMSMVLGSVLHGIIHKKNPLKREDEWRSSWRDCEAQILEISRRDQHRKADTGPFILHISTVKFITAGCDILIWFAITVCLVSLFFLVKYPYFLVRYDDVFVNIIHKKKEEISASQWQGAATSGGKWYRAIC